MTALLRGNASGLSKARGGQLQVIVSGYANIGQAWFGVGFVRGSTPPTTFGDFVEFYADALLNWARGSFAAGSTFSWTASQQVSAGTIAGSAAGDHMYLFVLVSPGGGAPDPTTALVDGDASGLLRAAGVLRAR